MKICENCGKEHEGTYGSGRFCTSKCARGFSTKAKRKEINKAVSKSLSGKRINRKNSRILEKRICKECNTIFETRNKTQIFCSRKCVSKNIGRKGGLLSSIIQQKRSKNEIYFSELCAKLFDKILINEQMFNGWDADIILENAKIAILWNGKWHYEKLNKKHSVKQVQNRDAIKINEIKQLGYIPYVIKDMGKYDKKFVESEFEKLKIYCGMEKLVISRVS